MTESSLPHSAHHLTLGLQEIPMGASLQVNKTHIPLSFSFFADIVKTRQHSFCTSRFIGNCGGFGDVVIGNGCRGTYLVRLS